MATGKLCGTWINQYDLMPVKSNQAINQELKEITPVIEKNLENKKLENNKLENKKVKLKLKLRKL